MKRFKTLICICLILIVASSMAIVIGRYAVSKNVTESSSEMQLAESKKNAGEVKSIDIDYGNSKVKAKLVYNNYVTGDENKTGNATLVIESCVGALPHVPYDYIEKIGHIVIEECDSIQVSAFEKMPYLTSVYIRATYMEEISDQAFFGSSLLKYVVISEGVQCIGSEAFGACDPVLFVYLQGDNSDLTIRGGAFGYSNVANIYCKPGSNVIEWAKDYTHQYVHVDSNGPEITPEENIKAWTSGNVIVRIDAGDDEANLLYNYDFGLSAEDKINETFKLKSNYDNLVINNNREILFTENGSVDVVVIDAVGNETRKTVKVNNIDKVKPTIISCGPVSYSDDGAKYVISASDTGSGIEKIMKPYSFDNGKTWQEESYKVFNKDTTITVKVRDFAGNTQQKTVKVVVNKESSSSGGSSSGGSSSGGSTTVDTTRPKINSIEKSTNGWTNGSVTLTVNASDASGIKDYSFNDGADWQTSNKKTFSSNTEVDIKVRDTAGNESAVSYVNITKIDKIAPEIIRVDKSTKKYTKDLSLIANAKDTGGSGIAAYSFNNGSTWIETTSTIYPMHYSQNTSVKVKVKDNAGNVSAATAVTIDNIDNTKPTISTVTGNATDWTNKDVTLTVTASDNKRLNAKAYSFNNGDTWQASNKKSFSSNQIVYIRVRDEAGNISESKSVTINKIDKNSPTVSVTGNPTAWTNKDVTLKVTAADSASGLHATPYSFDGGATWQATSSKTYTSNTNGIVIKVRDNVGNITTNTINITKIDKTVPGILKVDGNPTEWTKNSAKLTASATSNGGSEVIKYSFTNDASKTDWQPSNQKEFTSNQTVYVRAKDEAGNISLAEKVKIINVDQIKPTVKITGNPTSWTNKDVTLTITASDAESGLHSMPYSFDGGKTWSDIDTKVFTKNQVVNIQVRDKVGNIYETSVTISKIDKILPTVDITGNPADWTKNDVTLTITASDAESGLNTAQGAYSFDGGTTWSNTTSKVYTKNTNGIIIKVRDVAGNIKTYNTINITKIDKDAPKINGVTKNPDTWTTGNVTLIVTATDAGCGLHDTPYSFDGGKTWQKETSKVYTENTKNIVIKVRDKLENIATYDVVNITNIDRTPPVISSVTGNPKRWTNQDVTLKITATDAISGLHDTPYSFDGGKTWQKEATKVYDRITYDIVIKVRDKVGNTTTYSTIDIVRIDKTVPTITNVEGNVEDWTTKNVTLTVSTNENSGSPVEQFSFDDGKTWQLSNQKTFTKNEEVKIRVKDEAGNISPVRLESITKIDKDAPVVSSITGNPTAWTNKDVTLTINATDAGCDLHSTPYSFDGGSTWQTSNKKTFSSNQVVKIKVKDKLGNTYETSVAISKIDKVAPTISGVTGNPTAWTKGDVTLTITASDAESGLQSTPYSFDNGATWVSSNKQVFTQNKDVIIKVRDVAGNITTYNKIVINKIDKNAPTISSVVKNPGTWTTGNVTLTVTATDAGSGLHSSAYSFDGGSTWQTANTKTYTNNTNGIIIKVRDVLGNTATYQTINITNIDKTAPIISKVEGNPTAWTNKDVTLKITATDAGCGLHDTPYSFDGGKTWQKEASKIYKENTKNIVIKVKDKLGNTSTYSTIDITKIDKTVPTVVKVDGNPTEWTNGPVTLTVTITGNCGSCIISYSFDDGKTWQTSNKKTFANNQEVVIKVKDEAGNMSPSYNVSITKIRTAPDISIKSDVYEVDEVNINRVRQKTTVATFAEKIMHNASMKVYTKDNKELKDTDIIGTGMTAKFTLNGEEKTLNIVVTGDLTGDGKVTNSDMLRLARYMTGKEKGLDEIYLMASDVFEDNKYPNCVDLLKMARALVGLDKI